MTSIPSVVVQPLGSGGPREGDQFALGFADRLAAIDIGSNSIHMIVVAAEPRGGYIVLGREREMVRLGKSGLGKGALSETAMRNGLEALAKMTTLARLKGATRVVVVATSAVREATNGADFLARVKAHTGLDVQLLTGVEEGQLIYRAVREVVDLGSKKAAIVDIGGGSTEWIAALKGELGEVASLPLGSLRCARGLTGDPPSASSIERFRRRLARRIAKELPPGRVQRVVATSGTAACCADLVDAASERPKKDVSGVLREVRAKDLKALVARLRALRRQQIAALPAVGGPRSESLLAGAILLDALVTHAGVETFQVCDRALREGLVLAALRQPLPTLGDPAELRRRQILQLAQRAESVLRHNEQTARLAVRLFDLTASVHGLGSREREWLEYAALVHDIGYSVHYRNHHKHAYYLVTNAVLDAFDQREVEIIAHVARYHRGALPKKGHPTLAALRPWQQRTIRRLTVLLRLADALDRTHASRVDEIYAAIRKRRVTLEVVSRFEVALELEAARSGADDFAAEMGWSLRLRQGLEVL